MRLLYNVVSAIHGHVYVAQLRSLSCWVSSTVGVLWNVVHGFLVSQKPDAVERALTRSTILAENCATTADGTDSEKCCGGFINDPTKPYVAIAPGARCIIYHLLELLVTVPAMYTCGT